MNKFAIALLLAGATFASTQARASDAAVVGAVEGAIVGSHFGGAHGAVAGAILGTIIGNSAERNYDQRVRVRADREVVRYESAYPPVYQEPVYQPAPAYYAPPVAYQTYYEPQYVPQRVVYVEPPVYASYPLVYASYRGPAYVERYAAPHHVHYSQHSPRRGYNDHRYRY